MDRPRLKTDPLVARPRLQRVEVDDPEPPRELPRWSA
jgi:hypothetical protein